MYSVIKKSSIFLILSFGFLTPNLYANNTQNIPELKHNADLFQVESGSSFAGIEIHNGLMPNRLSFFYPLLNILEEPSDYWERGSFPVLRFAFISPDGKKELITGPVSYTQTPFSVSFTKKYPNKRVDISYNFSANHPAIIVEIKITNISIKKERIRFFTALNTLIHNSGPVQNEQSFTWTEADQANNNLYSYHTRNQAQNICIYVANGGLKPESFTTKGEDVHEWLGNNDITLSGKIVKKDIPQKTSAAFTYNKLLEPEESMSIIQIIGASEIGKEQKISSQLVNNYPDEIKQFRQNLLQKTKSASIRTNETVFDKTTQWSEFMLQSHDKYIDGYFVPVPCHAQYPYFFTHDTLVTDLAAVNFDVERVKRDLNFLYDHAGKDNVIPHAYYFNGEKFITEFTGDDGWNHFWFVLIAARYLRHTNDTEMIKKLYPLISTSLEHSMKNMHDSLISAYRPDWWDLGTSFGPRSYMTILGIRAIEEFNFLAFSIGRDKDKSIKNEEIYNKMKMALQDKLWDDKMQYLINYNKDKDKDYHYYIGSLLASHFNTIPMQKQLKLLNTAKSKLLDPKVGIYNAFPMDFDKLDDYFHFLKLEAGIPHRYMNGGIWYQGNAWYALGLIKTEQTNEAVSFIKKTMTIDGIISGPNGQPAMYEVRNGNTGNQKTYGTVDKPNFLWAAGWYIYTMYNLIGVRENPWNISLLPTDIAINPQFNLYLKNKLIPIKITGKGFSIKRIKYNNKIIPSAVIPNNHENIDNIQIERGTPENPYLAQTESIVTALKYKDKSLQISLKAFNGHNNDTTIISPFIPQNIYLNNKELKEGINIINKNNYYEISIKIKHISEEMLLVIFF